MAGQSVAAEPEMASSDHFIDSSWQRISAGRRLPPHVTHRLCRADRAVYAASRIAQILVGDTYAKENAAESGRSCAGLSLADIEALGIALVDLLGSASCAIDDLRDEEDRQAAVIAAAATTRKAA